MSYLELLRTLEKNADTPVTLLSKPPKAPSVSFGSTPPSVSGNFDSPGDGLSLAQNGVSNLDEGHLPQGLDPRAKYSDALVTLLPELPKALETLRMIHAEHLARLHGRGIARVLLTDWREALGLDELRFWRVMSELEEAGQIIREGGFARPNPDAS